LLILPAEKRLTAYQALNHPWFDKADKQANVPIDPDQFNVMKKFSAMGPLKKASINHIAR